MFEKSNKRGRAAFTLTGVPVSGIPFAEAGRIDADFDNWTAQAVVPVSSCPYQPDVGGTLSITGVCRCRIRQVTPDPLGGLYALELEPITRG